MKQLAPKPLRPQRGFSLPEIMVGMVIGLLGILIITQVTAVFETQRGNTTSGDDAQNGGAIALFGLQKEISQAGWGITAPTLIGRPLTTPFFTLPGLFPIIINPPTLAAVGDAGTDTLLVIYGNSNTSEGSRIENPTLTLPYQIVNGTGSNQATDGGKGFNVGDWVIPTQSGVTVAHAMFQVVAPGATGQVSVNGAPPALQYAVNNPNIPLLYNMGQSPSMLAFAVIGSSLSVCDYFANDCAANGKLQPDGPWQALAGNITSMRAQCAAASGVRIALINRTSQRNAQVVTNASPTWNPQDAAGVSSTQNVVVNPVAAWGAEWDHYRYKTFETVIPIRNAIWGAIQGC